MGKYNSRKNNKSRLKRVSRKRTSRKRTSRKRTSRKRTSKKKISKKRVSQKRRNNMLRLMTMPLIFNQIGGDKSNKENCKICIENNKGPNWKQATNSIYCKELETCSKPGEKVRIH